MFANQMQNLKKLMDLKNLKENYVSNFEDFVNSED